MIFLIFFQSWLHENFESRSFPHVPVPVAVWLEQVSFYQSSRTE